MSRVEPLSLRRKVALEIVRKAYDKCVEEHPLKQLFWECTLRCNLSCRHCGSDCKTSAGVKDMPLEHFLGVLDNIKARTDPHKVFVIVSGGEPLMRNDIAECGKAIYEKGFPWGMVSNALFLTPEKFQSLLDAGIHTMTVSLDGIGDEHNWMRGNKNSFDMVSGAIDMLVASKQVKFDVMTCVNRRNYTHLQNIKNFLIEKGVKTWRVVAVFPVGRAAEDPDIRNHFFACLAGVTVGSVLVDGSISACPSIRANFHQGNIYDDDFMDIWLNKFEPYRNREWMRKGECAECKYFKYCRGSGMHLRDDNGNLIVCPLHRLQ